MLNIPKMKGLKRSFVAGEKSSEFDQVHLGLWTNLSNQIRNFSYPDLTSNIVMKNQA